MRRRRLRRVDAKKDNERILKAPEGLENEYRSRLRKRVRDTDKFLTGRLEAAGATVSTVRSSAKAWASKHKPSKSWLTGFANRVDASATTRTNTVISRIAKISVNTLPSGKPAKAINAAFVRENVKLIKSIDARYFDDIAKVVRESLAAGEGADALSKKLQRRFQVSDSRADRIARDQTQKQNANITQSRQEDLGITKYEWLTSEDEKVREEHAARNGRVFLWSRPPPDGHPGIPIECRCVPLPVL